jgi:hypothetical protein
MIYHKKSPGGRSPEPFKIDRSFAQGQLKRTKEVSRPRFGINAQK